MNRRLFIGLLAGIPLAPVRSLAASFATPATATVISGGTFKLTFRGATTDMLPWNATSEDAQRAIDNLFPEGDGPIIIMR